MRGFKARILVVFPLLLGCYLAKAQTDLSNPVTLLDAIRAAITKHPVVQIREQQINLNLGLKQQASGAFDEILTAGLSHSRRYSPLPDLDRISLAQSGLIATGAINNNSDLLVNGYRLLRNGVSLEPFADLQRLTGNVASLAGANEFELGFRITFPLLRGRGVAVTTAEERAAILNSDASVLDLRYAISVLMTNVVTSYWQYVAANSSLTVAVGSEQRGLTLVENIRALIDADQQPRSDINNVEANLADRRELRIAAAQIVVEARQQLALDMGLGAGDGLIGRLVASDDFPDPSLIARSGTGPINLKQLVDDSLDRRSDYASARTRVESAQVLRDAARNQILPQLNLFFSTGYAGLAEGKQLSQILAAAGSRVQGLNATGGIRFEFRRGNNFLLGRLAEAEARLKQAELGTTDLSRAISSSVVSTLEAVRNAAARVTQAHESVVSFQSALDGERQKLALGTGSVVNTLTVEDRLTAALLREVQARLAYSIALIQFRFATGTLVPVRTQLPAVQLNTFTTFPLPLSGGR